MPEKIFEWKGYSWMNGQPWGVTHTKPNQLWYADANEAKIVDGSDRKSTRLNSSHS